MGELIGAGWATVGTTGLLGLAVLLVLTGKLVPRRLYLDMRQERDTWRQAHTESEKARQVAQQQVGELLELSRTAGHILTSLPRPDGQGVSSGAEVDGASTPGGVS
ncbi:hypothetical protein [Streptomyces sp. 6-11-2]|uniref:hypothetical protein n=1 Tax=Streptomyces sp. 6-11-2 TaxID=2585753 RepID=UPI00114481A1|nr:hypothetical protein [Streptomyces sp. 6-11-2]GED89317.1 hypothetical protein TNCT6_64020 [Streptomyces sp. 6-11-2]